MTNFTVKLRFLILAALITLGAGTVYGAGQMVLRQSANDPQIQLAEDSANLISQGASPTSLVASGNLEISQSLATYLTVYDDSGKPLTSSALLHGTLPTLPQGVFDNARSMGEARLTWQPEGGVREAIVVVHYSSAAGSGFAVAGRSLREVEKRESSLAGIVGIGWIVALAIAFLGAFAEARYSGAGEQGA